jgi:hypothetical protein
VHHRAHLDQAMKTSFQDPSAILFAVAPFFGRDCEFFGINVSVWPRPPQAA